MSTSFSSTAPSTKITIFSEGLNRFDSNSRVVLYSLNGTCGLQISIHWMTDVGMQFITEETVAPLPLPSANNSAMASGRIQEFIDAPNVVALASRADGGEIVESSSVLSNLGIEQASLLLSSTSKVMMGMGQQILNGPPAAWNGWDSKTYTLGHELLLEWNFWVMFSLPTLATPHWHGSLTCRRYWRLQ